jgi:hypothetical protein
MMENFCKRWGGNVRRTSEITDGRSISFTIITIVRV